MRSQGVVVDGDTHPCGFHAEGEAEGGIEVGPNYFLVITGYELLPN